MGHLSARRISPADADACLAAFPADTYVPYEQTAEWRATSGPEEPARSHYGFVLVEDGADVVALVSLDYFNRPRRKSLVSLTGPVFATPPSPDLERQTVEAIRGLVSSDSSIDPEYLRLCLRHPDAVPGAVPSLERGQFEREVVVDLTSAPEPLRKSYSSTTRNLVNRARRTGITTLRVRERRAEFFRESCYPMYESMGARKGFEIPPLAFIVRLLTNLPHSTELYATRLPQSPDTVACWGITTLYRDRGCYYLAASGEEARRTGAMAAMVDTMLTDLREAGARSVGLTGISSERWPDLATLDRFKLSFSKTVVEHPRLHDVPLRPLRYRVRRLLAPARERASAAARRLMGRGWVQGSRRREQAAARPADEGPIVRHPQ